MKRKIYLILPLLGLVCGLVAQSFYFASYDVETVSGDKFSWQDKKGEWIVVNFFAQWCTPCLREIPELNHFAKSSTIPLFMVSYDALSRQQLTDIIQQHGIKVPVIMTTQETILPMDYPAGLPATYIVSPDGKVVDTIMGEVKSAYLSERLLAAQTQLKGF